MTPSPILKVLSSMRTNGVRCLLMGGQACVLYGAAEFSRDLDLVVLLENENLDKLRAALSDLQADLIAVPNFSKELLDRGHAVHFRARHPDALGLRIDIMARMRGVEEFETLWARRTTLEADGVGSIDVLSLPDLVLAKKTQRDKDWPMIRRLVESNYFANRESPSSEQIEFWLREMRSSDLLIEIVDQRRDVALRALSSRPLLDAALAADAAKLDALLFEEEQLERRADQEYWLPLKSELARIRRSRRGE